MNTFVNYTGYCAYEMVFLKQPPSFLDFELDPIYDGLSLPAKEYLKLMENRFNLMKKIILDQKVKDQLAQYYREKRKYPNYNISRGEKRVHSNNTRNRVHCTN